MADAQKVIELIFQGVDKTGAATQAALDNAQKFSGSLKDITQPIADFTVGALKLEAGLLTAGAAATVFAVKLAGDFDTAFREIATLLPKPIEDLGDFRQAILDYANTSTAPLDQVTTAIYNAISAGIPLEQSIQAVATAEKLSIAGKADLNDTLKVLVSSLNAYGLGMDNADRFSDALFTTVKLGQTTLPELTTALSQVTGAAAAVGVPFETVLAALSTLTTAGTPTAQAVTQINAVLTSLIKPSSEASTLAKELGIEFNAQAVKAKGLEVVLQEVATATGGNQEQMGKLFGSVEALKAVFPLTGASAQKFSTDLDAMRTSAGATDAAFEKMSGNIEASGQKIQNALKGLFIEIGTPLLDEFGGIANAIAAIFKALGDSARTGGLGELVKYIEDNLQGLQTAVETVAKNLPAALAQADFSAFQRGIDAVLRAFGLLFDNIDLSTVNGLTRAIELAGAAFLGLSKFTAGVIESFKPLFDALVDVGRGVSEIDGSFFQALGNIAGFATQLNILAGGLVGLLPWLEALVGLLVAKQGLSLVGGLQAAVAAVPALSAALGPLALGASALYAGDQVVKLARALLDLKAANENLKRAQEDTNEITKVSGLVLEDFNRTTGLAAKSIDEALGFVDNGRAIWDDATNTWVDAKFAVKGVGDAAVTTSGYFSTVTGKWVDLTESSKEANKEWGQSKVALELQAAALENAGKASKQTALDLAELRYSQAGLLGEGEKVVPILDALTGAIVGYEKASINAAPATDKVGESLKKSTAEADKAREAAQKVALELEKLASNERIKTIEAVFKFNTAQLEEGTKRIEATFASIDNTVNSTGELIGDLFGILKDYDSLSFGAIRLIEEQLEAENKIRQEAFELQKRLTETQIEYMRAQLESMRGGDGLIKIDGAGLQPHLEAFMWEILKAIQVRVNSDGLKLLLGV